MRQLIGEIAGLDSDKGFSIYQAFELHKAEYRAKSGNPYMYNATESELAEFRDSYVETTEEVYWYFLEIMPPLAWSGGCFSVCEAYTDNVYSSFFRIGDRYFHAYTKGTISDNLATAHKIADAIHKAEQP